MSGITFSTNWNAVKQRIRKIPTMKIAEGIADTQRKRDANELVDIWRDGLQHNSLNLQSLKFKTIGRKRSLGYRYPSSPLYGLGMEGTKTYIKGMRVWKTAKGYTVHMIDGKHHDSKISLASLFVVHEYGTTINSNGKVIVIPARPAMQKAYARLLRRLKDRDPSLEFSRAINQYIREGKKDLIDKIKARAAEAEARNARV